MVNEIIEVRRKLFNESIVNEFINYIEGIHRKYQSDHADVSVGKEAINEIVQFCYEKAATLSDEDKQLVITNLYFEFCMDYVKFKLGKKTKVIKAIFGE